MTLRERQRLFGGAEGTSLQKLQTLLGCRTPWKLLGV